MTEHRQQSDIVPLLGRANRVTNFGKPRSTQGQRDLDIARLLRQADKASAKAEDHTALGHLFDTCRRKAGREHQKAETQRGIAAALRYIASTV